MVDIIFENSDYLVCIKPVGVQSQNDRVQDMVKLLTEQTGSEIFPVHRLDTAVGGTMVFAKNSAFAAELSRQIADRRFEKRYLAVLSGIPEEKGGVLKDLLFKDSRKNKVFVVKRERRGVKKASLEYTVLDTAQNYSLVRIFLHTGRTHQIRVQFASRKLPLVGDGKYGGGDNRCNVSLWSEELKFSYRGEVVSYKSFPEFERFPWNLFNFN